MSDEEIEFLGSKPPLQLSLPRPVTGIVLHVEKNGSTDGYRLTFNRSSSSVIHVGRRPGAESESRTRDIDSGRAMFRCAVVSRKHAKIAFTDSGHVYLIDLSSHHGTHVRKPGELFSKALQPERASPLSDGDLITFGKTVGRHEECVRPVVARVELVRGPLPIKPLVVPSTPSDKSTSGSSRHSSGRYGVYSSYSSDERPSTPSLDNDSEIEVVVLPIGSCSQSKHDSSPSSGIGRAFDMLKRLIPPSHTPNSGTEGAGVEGPAFTLAPITAQPDSSPSTLPPLQDAISFTPPGDSPAYKSRSNSPMDLESPSPCLAPTLKLPGALSLSPQASARSSPEPNASDHDEDSSSESRGGSESLSNYDEFDIEEARQKTLCVATPSAVPEPPSEKAPVDASEVQLDDLQELKKTLEKLQADVGKLDIHRRKYRTRFNNNVHRLAEKLSHYDDRLAEVNAQYDNLAEKVETISRIEIADIACQLEDMNEQVENLAYVDVPDLQTRVDGLDDDVSGILKRPSIDLIAGLKAEKEAETLQDLAKEIKQLRDATEAQMKKNLDDVKELYKAMMAGMISDFNQTGLIAVTEVSPAGGSSKRKRDDEVEEANDVDADGEADTSMNVDTCLAPTLSDNSIPTPIRQEINNIFGFDLEPMNATPIDVGQLHRRNLGESPPPRKRLRTVAKVVAQTATAVTIGAVATWSVLAFA